MGVLCNELAELYFWLEALPEVLLFAGYVSLSLLKCVLNNIYVRTYM